MSLTKLYKILDSIGCANENDIDLAEGALALAALESPGISLGRYQHHMKTLCVDVAKRHKKLLDDGADNDASTQLAALKYVISDVHGYEGNGEADDDLQNVNLIRVIDRRKGMPISLALLYIHVGFKQGWNIAALKFPAHMVCRIEKDGIRILFDPLNEGKILQAPDLRQLLKEHLSPQAELRTEYYEPQSKRDVLIAMQNTLKLRQIEGEDYAGALKTVELMRLIAPQEYRLLLDAGVLYVRTNCSDKAIIALEGYIEKAPLPEDRHDALILLRQIKEDLE